MNSKVYILGPMTGIVFYNFPAFDEAAAILSNGNFEEVINPAALDREEGFNPFALPKDHDWTTHPTGVGSLDAVTRRDVEALMQCDNFFCLDGWEKSIGARAEFNLLRWRKANRLFHVKAELPGHHGGFKIQTPADAYYYSPVTDTKELIGAPPVASDTTNPKDIQGQKKTPLRLISDIAMTYLARVMGLGAKKYGPYNWRDKKVKWTVYLEAARRHIALAADGEDADPESGMPHEAHAMACMAILLDAKVTDSLIDDRHKTGKLAGLMKQLDENG